MNDKIFKKPKIKILGIGGGGCNFQEHMISVIGNKLEDECFIAMNTDQQSLESSKAHIKIQLGPNGLGAGANPAIGREYAEYSENQIRELFEDCDLAIIFSALGGGTGSGCGPVVARIAREMNVLVFGIVTKPFEFEGRVRKKVAEEAIEEFKKYADVTVIVSNQLLFKITNQYTTFREAFKIIDNMCASFVGSILDIFRTNGLINVDFADIEATIKQKGLGLIGVGYADGEEAASEAAMKALGNPLLENVTMNSASNALVHISGNDISLIEVEEIMKKIHNELGDNVNIIHGMNIGEKGKFDSNSFVYPVMDSFQDNISVADSVEGPKKWVRVMIIVTGLSQDESEKILNDDFGKHKIKNILSNNLTETINEEKKEEKPKSNLFSLLQKLKGNK